MPTAQISGSAASRCKEATDCFSLLTANTAAIEVMRSSVNKSLMRPAGRVPAGYAPPRALDFINDQATSYRSRRGRSIEQNTPDTPASSYWQYADDKHEQTGRFG